MSDESKSESKNDRHAYVQKTGPRGGPTLEQGTSGELDECALCGGSELAVQHSAQEEFDEALRRISGKGAPSQTAPLGCLACGAGDGEYHRQGCSRLRELDEAVRRLSTSTPTGPAGVSVGSPAPEVPTPPAPTGELGDPAQGSTAQADGRDTRPTNIGDSRVLDDLVHRQRHRPIILDPAPSGTFDVGPSRNTRDIEDLQRRAKALEERATTLERHAEAVGEGLSRCEGSVAAMTVTHADRIETIEDEVRSLKRAVLELRELNSAQAFGARHAASREKLSELFDEVGPKYETLHTDPDDVATPAPVAPPAGSGGPLAGFWWLAEVPDRSYRYVKDFGGGVEGMYTTDALSARRWNTKAECAEWCASANEWLPFKVEPREHGFMEPRAAVLAVPPPAPTPAPEAKRPTVDSAYDRVVAVRDYLDLLVSIQPETRRITAALAASIGYVLPAPCPPPVAGSAEKDEAFKALLAYAECEEAAWGCGELEPTLVLHGKKRNEHAHEFLKRLRTKALALSRPVRP